MQVLTVNAVFRLAPPEGYDEDAAFGKAMDWMESVVTDFVADSKSEGWSASSLWGGSEWWDVALSVSFADWRGTTETATMHRNAVSAQIHHALHPAFTVHGFAWD